MLLLLPKKIEILASKMETIKNNHFSHQTEIWMMEQIAMIHLRINDEHDDKIINLKIQENNLKTIKKTIKNEQKINQMIVLKIINHKNETTLKSENRTHHQKKKNPNNNDL